jgi:5,5'-dehydrodivanillate O-demethylase
MGELLRRYWHPVAPVAELTEDQSTRFVRILGEDLVLFKDKSGNVGLIQDHCAHRGASLMYGRVEERGISCAYHGWLFNTEGNCLECPAEPAGSLFHLTVKMRAYPVRKFIGMYWAYLGPLPAPEIPPYDVWSRQDGQRSIDVYPRLDCSWVQAMENSADPAHLMILHQATAFGDRTPPNTTRGFTDDVAEFSFHETEIGLWKDRTYTNGKLEQHPLIFPNILRVGDQTQIRVPMDDTHTQIYFVHFMPGEPGSDDDVPVTYIEPFKAPAEAMHPFTTMRMDLTLAQDHMAWETQGPVADRTIERLATSDRGVVMYRQMLFREMDKVERGEDPMNVIRDPNHGVIDTNLQGTLEIGGSVPPAFRGAAATA